MNSIKDNYFHTYPTFGTNEMRKKKVQIIWKEKWYGTSDTLEKIKANSFSIAV